MQQVTQGTTSYLYLTLEELTTITSAKYLLKVTNSVSKESKYAILGADLSSYPYRYNKFAFTENDTEAPLSATLKLSPAGIWEYAVYQQSSSTNLDPSLADDTTPIEYGFFRVISSTTTSKVKYSGQTRTKKVYNG